MRSSTGLIALAMTALLAGCTMIRSETHNTSSLVGFLYPNGSAPPPQNAIPELRVPLRVGLAFLPSQSTFGAAQLDEPHKEYLLERIRQRFMGRQFVSDITIIPDYYLTGNKGFAGLEGVQRLYNVDVMALVSYDQVGYTDDGKLSLAYLTIVGAYLVQGTRNDTTTLVDLAVVDPKTRSLVLRAGGTDTHHGTSTLIDMQHDRRNDGIGSFDAATNQMISNFDAALTAFQSNVHTGKANVHVVPRNSPTGGGGALGWQFIALLGAVCVCRRAYQPTASPSLR